MYLTNAQFTMINDCICVMKKITNKDKFGDFLEFGYSPMLVGFYDKFYCDSCITYIKWPLHNRNIFLITFYLLIRLQITKDRSTRPKLFSLARQIGVHTQTEKDKRGRLRKDDWNFWSHHRTAASLPLLLKYQNCNAHFQDGPINDGHKDC